MHIFAIIEILAQLYFINHALRANKPRFWIFFLIIPWIGFIVYFFMEYFPEIMHPKDALAVIDNPDNMSGHAGLNLAYITQGKLYHTRRFSKPEQIQSRFGQKLIDQAVMLHQKNEWKTKGAGTHFGGSALWGIDQVETDTIRVFITSVALNLKKNILYYILENESTSGLFTYDYENDEEKRLFHRNNFFAKDLDLNPDTGELVCCRQFQDSTCNIITMDENADNITNITGGDSIDEAPSWIPGHERRILFQSAGIARNQDGYSVGRGPSVIQAIDLDNNRLTTVLENSRYDLLQPRISADGYMYYIRRPYEISEFKSSTAILDFFLFPFRLLRAVFHYLNFFSMVYSQKPLTTASGPNIKGDDQKTIRLKGKIIDAEKALRKGVKVMGVPSLVPLSWELVRRSQDNTEQVLARSVAGFNINSEGIVAYTNGRGIFLLEPDGESKLILQDSIIQSLVL